MRKIPEKSAIATLRSNSHCWRQFIAECRRSGVIERALDYCLSGFADRIVAGPFTAFQLLEPEAQAWLGYFRGIGAIAPGGSNGESIG